jgi:hypothetical protein
MAMRTTPVFALILLGTAGLLAACSDATSSTSSSSPSTTDDNIVGGVDARGKALDAVGYLYAAKADGTGGGSCTATLIAPSLVLTAKHCVLADLTSMSPQTMLDAGGKLGFRIGSDARTSTRDVFASEVRTCALGVGGSAGLGCDVAVLRLSEPVTDITPIPVATTPLGSDLIGQTFTAVGFGTQDAPSTIFGTRKMASLTLQATSGPGLHATFASYDDFAAFIDRTEGTGFVAAQGTFYRQRYDLPLLDGYEAQLGGADGNAQICHGDSGGPLLKVVDGKLAVYGVASTVVSGIKQVCENAGGVYATFGPDAQALFAEAAHDPCESVPAAGTCEGDVVVRCSRADEGARRVLRTDCSLLAQRCDAAACVD